MLYSCVLILLLEVIGSLGWRSFPIRKTFGYRQRYVNNGPDLHYEVVGSDHYLGEDIWRPCDFDDYACIRKILSSNSHCIPSYGYTPDPIRLPVEKYYIPVASMTITQLDCYMRGFKDARIDEFYINKATDNVVMTVTVPRYNYSAFSYFTYQRTGREPVGLGGETGYEIEPVIFTAIIPKMSYLRLDLAEIYADIPDYPPKYYIMPGARTSNDPTVQAEINLLIDNIVTVFKELLVWPSYLFMTTFIQNELCDFGVDSYKNYDGYALGKCYPGF